MDIGIDEYKNPRGDQHTLVDALYFELDKNLNKVGENFMGQEMYGEPNVNLTKYGKRTCWPHMLKIGEKGTTLPDVQLP